MAKTNRIPMQVSPEFKRKLDEIQRKIMMQQGQKRSLRDITEDIASSPLFNDFEKNLIKSDKNADIRIRLDMRRLL